jgi:hypothetical protein
MPRERVYEQRVEHNNALNAAMPLSPPNWGSADREGSEEEKEAKKKRGIIIYKG